MDKKPVYVTKYDIKQLKKFIAHPQDYSFIDADVVKKLKVKLKSVSKISPKQVPPYLVTMNSHVKITDLKKKKDMDYWLAYPEEVLSREDKLSVVSDLGLAILGLKVGDTVEYSCGNQKEQVRISCIHYQPEANNHKL